MGEVMRGQQGVKPSLPAWLASRELKTWLARLAVLVASLAIWEFGSRWGLVDARFFSSPSQILSRAPGYIIEDELLAQTLATLKAVIYSLLVGIPAGVAAGAVLGAFRFLDDVVDPFLVPLNSLPRIALAPLFILWFGLTTTAKVALAVSLVFFMVLFNTRAGIKSVDPDLLKVVRLLGLSRRQIFWKVMLPSAVPVIFAAVRLAVTYSLLGVVAAEMIGSRNGLGQDIVFYSNTLQVAGVFTVLAILAFVGFALSQVFGRLEGWLLRWR